MANERSGPGPSIPPTGAGLTPRPDTSLVPTSSSDQGSQVLRTGLTAAGIALAGIAAAEFARRVDVNTHTGEVMDNARGYTSLIGVDRSLLTEREQEYLDARIALRVLQEPSRREERVAAEYDTLAAAEEYRMEHLAELSEQQQVMVQIRSIALNFARQLHVGVIRIGDKIQDFRESEVRDKLAGKVAKAERKQWVQPDVTELAIELGRLVAEVVRNPQLSDEEMATRTQAARQKAEEFNEARRR